MTSTILTGERRWASARKTGMTVLGKVAVPKPINLPSQRLENHGLDPNVEIVPKGTLSWGSRSSSSSSNPWSSSQSPNTDGSTSSLSYLSGRPSSGGSGTRPSTAGSDRAHESTASSGGPNSRPSSASGPVGSNQNSLAFLRPRSAETRPSSSHLSRFTEASSENPIAWSSAATAEKLGVVQYKDEGFALTSGDFPVLGSEKGNGRKNSESRGHESTKRPGSSSGGVALTRESSGTSETDDVSRNENVKITTVNSWSRDNSPYGEDGDWYGTEKWQRHSHPYTGANMVSPPFDTFNCIPPNNPQGGVLNRGPRGGLPCGPPAPPTGFPMEPFPYYYSHLSAGHPANSQSVHPARVGPRGHHSQTDVYRNPVPDAFVRPAMPIRPGFFPGPVPYEGCYGPSRSINDRDAAFPGLVSVKGDSSHSRDSQISLKVLTNLHNCCDEEIVEQNGDRSFEINHPPHAIIDQPRTYSHIDLVDKQRISLQEKSGLDNGNDGKPDYISGKYGRVASKPQNDAHEIEKSTIHSKELPVLSTENAEGGIEELVEHNQSVSLNHVNVLSSARKDTLTQIRDGNHTNLKRLGYKDKQSLKSVKKLTEKCTFDNVHETQLADISASIGKSNLPVTVNSESSTHSRKKKNKSGKSKNKFEDGSSSALPTSLSEEKTHTKIGKSISEPEALATSEDTNHSSDNFSSRIEDSQEKGNGPGKSHHSRRKWAPVRSLNKSEVTNEANQITEVQASSSIKADLMQSISRNNRAEMEGYIPKPVAREMVQQGSIQHPEICSINQTTLDDHRLLSSSANNIDGRSTGFSTAKKGSISESRFGDGQHYKHRKSHRLWQQLREVELKNGQQDQSGLKSAEPQQLHKGQRVMRNNFDLDKKKLNKAKDEKKCTQSFGNEVGQRDFTAASKKNRGFGERPVSQWQPKGFSSNNQHGNRSNDSQNIRKESPIDPSAKGILNGPNASHRGATHSINGGPVNVVEIPPAFHDGKLGRGSDAFQDSSSGH